MRRRFPALSGLVLLVALQAPGAAPLAPCENGTAQVGARSHACLRVDLLAQMSIAQLGGGVDGTDHASDIWGWVDDQGTADPGDDRAYAIVGLYCSTAFVDVTTPETPVLVGVLPDRTELDGSRECTRAAAGLRKPGRGAAHDEEGKLAGAIWRDIKVLDDRAYIVSDHGGPGLQVFDLSLLRGVGAPPAEFGPGEQSGTGSFNSHNVFAYRGADGKPYVVTVGSTGGSLPGGAVCNGGPLFFDADASPPVLAGRFCSDGYTHDIECVIYAGPDADYLGREVCFASNEDTLTIFDASDKSGMRLIARAGYSLSAYTHQGSLDAQHRYFYLNDELDEQEYGLPTRTLVWDLADLDAPRLAAEYLAPAFSIDHNNYVHGDYLFQSNYTSGLRILDISDRAAPWQKAYFDSYPAGDPVAFEGTWSNYRFPDGLVALSDMSGGLFLLRPELESAASETEVAVTVTAARSIVPVGSGAEFSVELANLGAEAAGEVVLFLTLQEAGSFDAASLGTASACELLDARRVECRYPELAAGALELLSLRVTGSGGAGEPLVLQAMASPQARDAAGVNNVQRATVLQTPLLAGGGGGQGLGLLALLLVLWPLRRRGKRF